MYLGCDKIHNMNASDASTQGNAGILPLNYAVE